MKKIIYFSNLNAKKAHLLGDADLTLEKTKEGEEIKNNGNTEKNQTRNTICLKIFFYLSFCVCFSIAAVNLRIFLLEHV
jgi:hypothetical protein